MKIIITESQLDLIKDSILRTNLKGKNILYHATLSYKAMMILNQDELGGRSVQQIKSKFSPSNKNISNPAFDEQFRGVSFTRNPNFKHRDGVILVLDGDLIKRDFGKRLMPYDYFSYAGGKADPQRFKQNESEEFLLGDLKPLSKYLRGISFVDPYDRVDLNKDKLEYFQSYIRIHNIPVFDYDWNEITTEFLSIEVPEVTGVFTEGLNK